MTAHDAPSSLGPVPDPAPAISAPAAPARPAGSLLGQLVDETPDAMTLHTQDAYRMFTGRAADLASNANCHPFFTGKPKLLDTAGRIERFSKKYEQKQ